jgi:hypothetical protein
VRSDAGAGATTLAEYGSSDSPSAVLAYGLGALAEIIPLSGRDWNSMISVLKGMKVGLVGPPEDSAE